MSKLEVKSICVGMVATNCYLAANTETKEAVIIDPGDEASRIEALIRENQYHPVAILLTHGHFDHVLAAPALAEEYQIKIYLFEGEKETLADPNLHAGTMVGLLRGFDFPTVDVKDGEILRLAGFQFQVLFTPGHTQGGVCYYIADEGALFSGDTLFSGSVGRTDFPRGSMSQLIAGIREKLLVLPDETFVYPGHDSSTTIGREKAYNMYL